MYFKKSTVKSVNFSDFGKSNVFTQPFVKKSVNFVNFRWSKHIFPTNRGKRNEFCRISLISWDMYTTSRKKRKKKKWGYLLSIYLNFILKILSVNYFIILTNLSLLCYEMHLLYQKNIYIIYILFFFQLVIFFFLKVIFFDLVSWWEPWFWFLFHCTKHVHLPENTIH